MRAARSVTIAAVLAGLPAFAGCFTDLKHPGPEDANVEPGEAAVPGTGGTTQEAGPVAVDATRDVPLTTGGAGGFDAGGEARAIDGPWGSGGIAGAPGSGGTTGPSGGAGGGTPMDAPVDQKVPGPVGTPCALGSDCALGNCVDGVCCATACAGCNACSSTLTGKTDGTCAPALTGRDPHDTCADETTTKECGNDGTCDGAGACRKVSTSHVCKAGSCSSTTFTPASTCDGLGACTTPTPENCAPYQCAATGCLISCSSQTDCGATSYCKITSGTTGTCTTKNPNGTPATQGFECTSSIVADGVCCDKACTGCNACSGAPLTGAPAGTCSFVLDGQIAHAACTASGVTCGLDGKCDGAGACRYAPVEGASCNDPANLCVTGRICQSHVCTPGTTKTCTSPPECQTGGTCLTSTGQCSYSNIPDNTTCVGDGNACSNHACQAGTCVATLKPCNSPTPCHVSPGSCSGGTCSYPTAASNGSVDYTCPGGTQYCYGGQCVQCTDSAQCSGVRPSCDTSSHACVCRKPSAGNVLKNPGFDGSLGDWTTGVYSSYSTIDADGCPESGSVYVNGSSEGDPIQCFPVTALWSYNVGVRSRAGRPGGQVRFHFYSGANCTGSIVDTQSPISFSSVSPDDMTWSSFYGYSFTAPSTAVSADFFVYAWDQWLDQMYVNHTADRF